MTTQTTQTTSKPTEKQLAFRASLISQAQRGSLPEPMAKSHARAFLQTALLLHLPAPTTSVEASAHIDALRGDWVRAFGTAAWGQALIARMTERVGRDGSGIAKTAPSGFEWTAAEWVAYVRETLA